VDTVTLTEFVTARLDEDEAAATGATPGPWAVGGSPDAMYLPRDFVHAPGYRPEGFSQGQNVGDASVADGGMGPWAVSVRGSGFPQANATHIARWDPARVLGEVDAKRKILAEHRIIDGRCHVCTAIADGHATRFRAPCWTLLALASVYSDHPDYDQEWSRA
jgi:hypothetical protein